MKVPEYACSCTACKEMCERTPCLGTPEEMLAIKNAGFGDKLVIMRYYDTYMLSPDSFETRDRYNHRSISGRCRFLTPQRLCQLHDLGLKPIEGRAAIHEGGEVPHDKAFISDQSMFREGLARSWERPIGRLIIKRFIEEYDLEHC